MFPLITCFHKSRILAVGRGIRGEKCWWGWGVLMGLLQGRQVAPLARPQHVHLAPGSSAYSTITWTKSSCTHTGHAVHTELEYTKIMLYRLRKRSQGCAVKIEQMYSTHRLYCTVHMERCTEVMLYIWSRCTEVMLYIWSRCTKVMLYMVCRCTHRYYSTYWAVVHTDHTAHITVSRCTHRLFCTYWAGVHTGHTVHIEQVYTKVILYILSRCTHRLYCSCWENVPKNLLSSYTVCTKVIVVNTVFYL